MKPSLVVLAAGAGSRYGGIKQIDSIGNHGECILDYSVYDAKRAGFGKVYFIIRKSIEKDFTERITNRISGFFPCEYIYQEQFTLLTKEQAEKAEKAGRTKPWGTAHALLCAKDSVKEPFVAINADDFYGSDSYKVMGEHLKKLSNESTDYGIVTYNLKKTMSRSGSVSRGICKEEDGWLKSITEHTKISFEPEDSENVISEFNGEKIKLTGNEWASMNFFGFTPVFFRGLETFFDDFIKENAGSLTKEAFLPSAATEQIAAGKGRIKFLKTTGNWYGMTYKEDREKVKQGIESEIRAGVYPEKLWT